MKKRQLKKLNKKIMQTQCKEWTMISRGKDYFFNSMVKNLFDACEKESYDL